MVCSGTVLINQIEALLDFDDGNGDGSVLTKSLKNISKAMVPQKISLPSHLLEKNTIVEDKAQNTC